jgi:adenosine deaminase
MNPARSETPFAALPKAELHLHLEGSIAPTTAALLATRNGFTVNEREATRRYSYTDFNGFLDAFKWVTKFLQTPEDYSLILHRLIDDLLRQNVLYAEITTSVSVMLKRGQNVEANFAAMRETAQRARDRGLQIQWIFDAARQFGPASAMEVAQLAARLQMGGVVAFGMGGDELAYPAEDFRAAYTFARSEGLHVVAHAGEIGGPDSIQDAIERLGAERIGHGIAAIRDPALMDSLAARRIPLENCISSNFRTGALARQLEKTDPKAEDHPLKTFFDRGMRIVLSTDDPAMFHTNLLSEYEKAAALGFQTNELVRLAQMSFEDAFLPPEEKRSLLESFQSRAKSLGLL